MKKVIIAIVKKHLVSFVAGLASAVAVALGSGCKMQMTDFSCEISLPEKTSSSSQS